MREKEFCEIPGQRRSGGAIVTAVRWWVVCWRCKTVRRLFNNRQAPPPNVEQEETKETEEYPSVPFCSNNRVGQRIWTGFKRIW